MNNLTPFDYDGQNVRVVLIDDEPWFVLADLCKVLDLEQVSRVKARLDDALTSSTPIKDSMGRTQQATVVSEPGMYEVVIRSDKPEAVTFRRWITSEVLPTIRKTGGYGKPRELTQDEIVAQALQITAARVEALTAKVAELAPKAHTWDDLCGGTGDYTITDAAKVLARAGVETGPRKLHEQMLELGWVYKNQRGKWTAAQAQLNAGCLAERVRSYIDDNGVTALATPQVRITPKGMERLRALLATPLAELIGAEL